MPGNWGLIDLETPKNVYTRESYTEGKNAEFQLVFSDEFNTDGRSFYPGDDPYWEALDLHYWAVCTIDPGCVASGSLGTCRLTTLSGTILEPSLLKAET